MVDIESIEVLGQCGISADEVKKEALKFIMAIMPEIANVNQYSSFQLHVKLPKCLTNYVNNFYMIPITYMIPCIPDDCCLAQYEILALWNKVQVFGQNPYQNVPITCTPVNGDGCNYSCDILDFTPNIALDIYLSDFGGSEDPCLADCFWRLDGNNNVTDNSFIGSTIDKPVVFKANNQEAMRILPNGNVGIGTVDPVDKFEVQFETPNITGQKITFGERLFNPSIRLYHRIGEACPSNPNHEKSYPWWIEINDEYARTGVYGGLFFRSHDGVGQCSDGTEIVETKVAFLRNGNVGIGIENPQSKLEVNGNIKVGINGKVEIGDNCTDAKLSVMSSGSAGLTKAFAIRNTDSYRIFEVDDIGNVSINGTISTFSNDPVKMAKLYVGTGNFDPAYNFQAVGNAQINGTTDITSNLKVHGTIYTTEVLITDPTSWPDFVFDKNYKLSSLTEISQYIKKYGHLPEVPSKSEVEKDGIKLVEMQKIMLKKVEELTLHLIELEKKNDILKEEIENLKNTNK
jgi:hypothetical protein